MSTGRVTVTVTAASVTALRRAGFIIVSSAPVHVDRYRVTYVERRWTA